MIVDPSVALFVKTPRGQTTSTTVTASLNYSELITQVWDAAERFDLDVDQKQRGEHDDSVPCCSHRSLRCSSYLVHEGRILDEENYQTLLQQQDATVSIQLRLLGGIDRQNRVGSKFGGGGVSSSQNAERERKDRLKRLALESIDLAKDPYLMRNHLGTYECKLCLTLHPNEANYLAHTQGKKHQQGLARRAYLETKKAEKEAANAPAQPPPKKMKLHKVRIGRPAYQVMKSRDPDSNQRCLSFELSYPEIQGGIQPRHRFMSAFEQQVDTPPDRRYQYLLLAAEPYETVAFKIPNEPLDKSEGKFVTHWDADTKKFTLTLYYADGSEDDADKKPEAK
jgi:splicing factor 3A subunit 2